MRARVAVAAAGTICALAAASALGGPRATVSFEVVAASGDAVPGTDGVLAEIYRPTLNESGDTAFGGTLEHGVGGTSDADDGVAVVARSGALELVAREGDPAPGTEPNWTFGGVHLQTLDDAGNVYQHAELGNSVDGIWKLAPGGSLALHFLSDAAVQQSGTPAASAAGHNSFVGNNGSRLWAVPPEGGVVEVARVGPPAPDITLPFVHFQPAVLNRAGAIAFVAEIDAAAPAGDLYASGIWHGSNVDDLALVARAGEPAPGAPGFVFNDFGVRDLGETGTFGFQAYLAAQVGDAPSNGVWLAAPDGVRLVARRDDPAPTGRRGDRFANFWTGVYVDDAEHVVFTATLRRGRAATTAENDETLWRFGGTDRPLLAREGQLLGDGSAARIAGFDEPTLGDGGTVVCRVGLRGPGVSPRNDEALLYFPPSGRRVVLLREGSRFKLGPGDRRRIRNILLEGTEQGWGRPFVDSAGRVALSLEFADHTYAAVIATVTGP